MPNRSYDAANDQPYVLQNFPLHVVRCACSGPLLSQLLSCNKDFSPGGAGSKEGWMFWDKSRTAVFQPTSWLLCMGSCGLGDSVLRGHRQSENSNVWCGLCSILFGKSPFKLTTAVFLPQSQRSDCSPVEYPSITVLLGPVLSKGRLGNCMQKLSPAR